MRMISEGAWDWQLFLAGIVSVVLLALGAGLALLIHWRRRGHVDGRRILAFVVIALALASGVAWFATRWLTIEGCLDTGGRWNDRTRLCERY